MFEKNLDLLKLLYSKRKHIIIVSVAAGILAAAASYLIKPLYKSTGVYYPANIAVYGEESTTEQLMQFFQSKQVRYDLLKRFDLAKHYELDTNDSKFDTYFNYIFEDNVKINQTRFESVQVDVLDTDPVFAKNLVEGINETVNQIIAKAKDEKTVEFVKMYEVYLKDKQQNIDSIQNLIKIMGEQFGIIDVDIQLEQASRYYYKGLSEGKKNDYFGELNNTIKNLGAKGAELVKLMTFYREGVRQLAEVKYEQEKLIKDLKKKFTYTTVVSYPTVPDSKYWPKRGMISAIAALSVFVLSCIYFVYIERIKKIASEITHKK